MRAQRNKKEPAIAAAKAAPQQDYRQQRHPAIANQEQSLRLMCLVTAPIHGLSLFLSQYKRRHCWRKESAEAQQAQHDGYFVTFQETLPQFVIKHADVELLATATISSEWHGITHQHDITGKPTQFKLSSSNASYWRYWLWWSISLLGGQLNAEESGYSATRRLIFFNQ